jgi:histone H1/5
MAKKKDGLPEVTDYGTPKYHPQTHMGVIHGYTEKGDLVGVTKAADPEAGNPAGKPWDIIRLHNEMDNMSKKGITPKFSLVERPKTESADDKSAEARAKGSATTPMNKNRGVAKPKPKAPAKKAAIAKKPAAKTAAKPAAKKPVAKKTK